MLETWWKLNKANVGKKKKYWLEWGFKTKYTQESWLETVHSGMTELYMAPIHPSYLISLKGLNPDIIQAAI